MRTFMFRDVINTLATGERASFITVRARNRKSAIQEVELINNRDGFIYFGKVFFTAATFTTATKTLTLTGAFTRYLLANSTRIVITQGTGMTLGEYVIASRSSDNAIILTTDPGGTNPSNVNGYIIGGRTLTYIERSNDNPMVGFPGNIYGSDGVSLSKGVAPNDAMRGVLYEQYVAAT